MRSPANWLEHISLLIFGVTFCRSCQIFQEFSDSLAHIVKHKTGRDLDWYLDDFFFVQLLLTGCNGQVAKFLEVCSTINIPVAPEKTIWGTQIIEFLGLLLNTITQTIIIPEAKRQKALEQLDRITRARKVLVIELQSLTGLLNFLTRAVVPGRAFTRRMYAKYSNMKQYHHVRIDRELRFDCFMWQEFLSDPNCVARPFVDFSSTLSADDIEMTTDASLNAKLGFAGCYSRDENGTIKTEWFVQKWPDGFIDDSQCSIELAELIGVTCAVVIWAKAIANRRVAIWCDNQSVMWMVNKASAKCRKSMYLIRIITATCMKYNCRVFCKYIATDDNKLADNLSRLRTQKFMDLAPEGTDHQPLQLPQILWPFPDILWEKL